VVCNLGSVDGSAYQQSGKSSGYVLQLVEIIVVHQAGSVIRSKNGLQTWLWPNYRFLFSDHLEDLTPNVFGLSEMFKDLLNLFWGKNLISGSD